MTGAGGAVVWSKTRNRVAAFAAAAIVLAGVGPVAANWSALATPAGVDVATGLLDLELTSGPIWARHTPDGLEEFNPEAELLDAAVTYSVSASWQIDLAGDNLAADLVIDTPAVTAGGEELDSTWTLHEAPSSRTPGQQIATGTGPIPPIAFTAYDLYYRANTEFKLTVTFTTPDGFDGVARVEDLTARLEQRRPSGAQS